MNQFRNGVKLKHNKLVEVAKWWLVSAKGCNPVFTEKGSARISEVPDAIGWVKGESILVECKSTRADFLKDKAKNFRIATHTGMGNWRYFLFTKELYEQVDVKIPEGWGVLVCDDRGQAKQIRLRGSSEFPSNLKAERDFLRSRILEVQRYGQ